MFWVPSISPSSIIFYTGDRFPSWKNNLFVGALSGKQLQRVAFDQPSQAERRESLLTQLNIRIRDLQQGPDGLLYVATELASGGNDPNGTILRIDPPVSDPVCCRALGISMAGGHAGNNYSSLRETGLVRRYKR